MTNKPLKTVESLLKDYNGYDFCGEIACSGQNKANELIKELNAHYYQLMLSLVGEDELYYRPYLVATTKITTSQNQTQARMVLRNRNKLRAELRKKLSEHFNGEGEA